MKKILFFARDPGGANVIIPLYKKMKYSYETYMYGKEFALKVFEKAYIGAKDIDSECMTEKYNNVKEFLKNLDPDIVVTGTSLDDFTERFLWQAANESGIKSVAILDQWMNLGVRFSGYKYNQIKEYDYKKIQEFIPSSIFVMDQWAKDRMIEDGIAANKIFISGQPYFDEVKKKYEDAEEILDSQYYNIVFVSEPISHDYDQDQEESLYWGYNEKRIFESLYKVLVQIAKKKEMKIRLLVRPHPRESTDAWNQYIAKLNCNLVKVECDARNANFDIIKSVQMICGMSSMFLLESAICNKAIVSIEIGLCRDNPFILDRLGYRKSVMTEKELKTELLEIIEKRQIDTKFNFIDHATDHAVTKIEEMLK